MFSFLQCSKRHTRNCQIFRKKKHFFHLQYILLQLYHVKHHSISRSIFSFNTHFCSIGLEKYREIIVSIKIKCLIYLSFEAILLVLSLLQFLFKIYPETKFLERHFSVSPYSWLEEYRRKFELN